MQLVVDAMTVLDWPEFKALAERMRIDLGVSTTRLAIDLQEGCNAVVMHEYRAPDRLFEVSSDAVSPEEVVPTWRRGS